MRLIHTYPSNILGIYDFTLSYFHMNHGSTQRLSERSMAINRSSTFKFIFIFEFVFQFLNEATQQELERIKSNTLGRKKSREGSAPAKTAADRLAESQARVGQLSGNN